VIIFGYYKQVLGMIALLPQQQVQILSTFGFVGAHREAGTENYGSYFLVSLLVYLILGYSETAGLPRVTSLRSLKGQFGFFIATRRDPETEGNHQRDIG
jgi:hypothetical protein